jgi:hypothetical protein
VTQITGETATFIWHQMPYARGLQYQTHWLEEIRGIECEKPGASLRRRRME